ncbi:hypothetical protein VOLCADRAFT_98147 [Volvox carteri f. nagariensis]|uniref:Uncharacterized protein n=1 Tax=Volvox carteri f. nagariensis TaxID=3068 RepID=D8UEK3_VOLCA|nr:uncharacterized protein VOLCADRAFT_98147 [Volvox carteri f. nagariensis]EFJ41858.1 hypothetical protein VOLCADRAFT_98147 [Volvox carteri f. nagariensis]|eukprot:XP_002957056.1 hypothetical protein VOLCADRAFT_98147 [Volvox carteri f. nagariensis]
MERRLGTALASENSTPHPTCVSNSTYDVPSTSTRPEWQYHPPPSPAAVTAGCALLPAAFDPRAIVRPAPNPSPAVFFGLPLLTGRRGGGGGAAALNASVPVPGDKG